MSIHVSPNHSFNINLASIYGIREAVLIHHFQYWIMINKTRKENEIEGRTWSYQTIEQIHDHFPYMSIHEIRTLLDKLCNGKSRKSKSDELEFEPVLIKGYHSSNKFDRTPWYAFVNEDEFVTVSRKKKDPQDSDNKKDKDSHNEKGSSPNVQEGSSPNVQEGSSPPVINKDKDTTEDPNTHTPPPTSGVAPPVASRVCPETQDSLLCLEDLGNLAIIPSHRDLIFKECQETATDTPISTKKLVERVNAWEDRKCGDFSACKTILSQWDVWQDIETAQSKQKKEEEKKIVEIDKTEVRKQRLIRLAQQVPSLGWQVRSLSVERKIVQNGIERVISIYFNDSEKDKFIDELEEKFNLKSA